MKITEIKYTERLNTGSYQFAELTATAAIEEGEEATTAILTLKTFVQSSLKGEIVKLEEQIKEKKEEVAKLSEEFATEKVVVPVETKEEVKEEKPKRTRKSKVEEVKEEKPTPDEVTMAMLKESPKKKSKITHYGAENKAVLQAYLTKKYAESWKTCKARNEIIDFTSKLVGRDFLDEEGNIVPSFLDHIHSFFGQ